jgi:pyocin large subunit-like protein
MRRVLFSSAALMAAAALAACSGKPSAVTGAAGTTADQAPSGAAAVTASASSRSPDPRDAPVPKIDGKPMWAANRKHTAEENAQYQFAKNGGDFDAKSESEYVSDVHRFVDHPPRGVETLDRPNGDKLIYDPKANVFAVIARNGAPRTMFKPRDGESYWTEQKDREANRGKAGGADGGAQQS